MATLTVPPAKTHPGVAFCLTDRCFDRTISCEKILTEVLPLALFTVSIQ